ncbi:MAG: hypothetical protein O2819_04355 [Planctomycetota bacterium]|nr:hypothetical protein [Planctomycetota bacterium]MDA1106684.1 hypothetical protein [Planctomycetota bacterium]
MIRVPGPWLGLALSLLLAAAGLTRVQAHEATPAAGHTLASHHDSDHHHHHHRPSQDAAAQAPCPTGHPDLELACCCSHTHAPLGAIEGVPSGVRARSAGQIAQRAQLAHAQSRAVFSVIPPRRARAATGEFVQVRPPGHLQHLRTVIIQT